MEEVNRFEFAFMPQLQSIDPPKGTTSKFETLQALATAWPSAQGKITAVPGRIGFSWRVLQGPFRATHFPNMFLTTAVSASRFERTFAPFAVGYDGYEISRKFWSVA
jgi:hypothetical protein